MVDKAQYFRSLEDRYGLPEGYLSRTETIESQGNVRAYNKNSGAAGPFQFVPKSQKEFNLKDPYSLEESAEAAARMAARNKVSLQRQGIENPTAADLYAAHQQGAKGYVDLLRAGDQPASKVVGEDAVVWNGGKPNMSASEFANKITNKFSGDASSQPKTFSPPSAGVLEKPKVDVAETPEQAAALEGQQAALSTQDVLDTANASSGRSGNGLKELGFLHNYFKSLDTSATGVKPLAVPDFFLQQRYKEGGIVSLKENAKQGRATGIAGIVDTQTKNDKTYFRGMSNREYRSFKKTGHIKSTGEYNVGSSEKGLTFFSKDPAEAAFYAHEYAPLKYKATATKPAYVVEAKIHDSKKKIDAPGGVGVNGKIHEKHVVSVHRGRPTENGMEWATIHSPSDPVKKIQSIAVLSQIRKGL